MVLFILHPLLLVLSALVYPASSDNYAQGNQLLKQQDYRGAVTLYQAALQHQPSHWQSYVNMGEALMRLNVLDAAEASYRTALLHQPRWSALYSNLAIVLSRRGGKDNLNAALGFHKTAVNIAPADPSANFNLGTALGKADRWKEALPHLQLGYVSTDLSMKDKVV